jgi:hypothetical protein
MEVVRSLNAIEESDRTNIKENIVRLIFFIETPMKLFITGVVEVEILYPKSINESN